MEISRSRPSYKHPEAIMCCISNSFDWGHACSVVTSVMTSPSSSRLSPPAISIELYSLNREKLFNSLREHLTSCARPLQGFVLLQGGEEQTRDSTDHLELFRQESYFAYLFGVIEPGCYGAIDIASGKSTLFAPRLPADYAVWMGEIKPLSYFQEKYKVTQVFYTDEITEVLLDQYQATGTALLFLLHGLNTDSNKYTKPAEFQHGLKTLLISVLTMPGQIASQKVGWKGIEKFQIDLNTLHPILTECRVVKSDLELALIQFAIDISSEAHVEVMRKTKVGMKEYQLESMFLHHTYMYGGCRHCSYTCICATGNNSAVLHYGHAAAPNDKTLQEGDMALLDMGAEYHFYGSDITCSFPVNGKFTRDQSLLYTAVLDAHDAVISSMRPGVSWVDMHKSVWSQLNRVSKLDVTHMKPIRLKAPLELLELRLAERIILESLKKGHLLVGDVDKMMAKRLGAVFLPHGLGHLLGIDTHDPGGYLKGAERPKEPGLSALRTSRKLLEGMVITVEPGCYFIDALLFPALENPALSEFFNRVEINRFRNFGGIRIESDVFVTSSGCINMTKCPRRIEEIEAVMAGIPWPIKKTTFPSENRQA